MSKPEANSADLTDARRLVEFRKSQIQLFQSYAGFVFILISAASFAAAIYFVLKFEHKAETQAEQGGLLVWLAQQVPQASVLLIGSLIGALLGAWLLRSAMQASAKTIPDEDRDLLNPLITKGDENAINQYMRLSSLTGGSGFFAKLGFTGLPLVTAALGILLIGLAMFSHDEETTSDLMDLAKLVIGAFIGSFVQRKVEQGKDGGSKRPEDAAV